MPKYHVYNRVLVEGMPTPVFSGKTLAPPELPSNEEIDARVEKVIRFSRQRYAKPRNIVEEKISRWTRPEGDKRKAGGKGP